MNRPRMSAGRAYELAVTAVVLAATVVSAGRMLASPLAGAIARVPSSSGVALVTAAALSGTGLWLLALHFAGPVGVSRLAQRWRVPPEAPDAWIRRRTRRRTAFVVLAAALLALWIAACLPGSLPMAVAFGTAAFAVLGSTGGMAVLAQHHDLAAGTEIAGMLLVLLGLAALYLVTVPIGCVPLSVSAVGWAIASGKRAVGGNGRRLRRSSGLIPRWELRRGAEGTEAFSASVVMMDGHALRSLRLTRSAASRAVVRLPSRLPVGWRLTLLSALRSLVDRRLGWHVACLALPAACSALGSPRMGAAVVIIGAFLFWRTAASALDHWLRFSALRRMIPIGPLAGTLAIAIPVVAATLGYAAAGAHVAGLAWSWAPAVVIVCACAQLRTAIGRSGPATMGPFLSTPGGVIPVGIVTRLVAGSDLVCLAVLVTAAGQAPFAMALILAAISGVLLLWALLRRSESSRRLVR